MNTKMRASCTWRESSTAKGPGCSSTELGSIPSMYTWWPTIVCDCSSRRSYALLWSPWAPSVQVEHTHICRQNTQKHKKLKRKRNEHFYACRNGVSKVSGESKRRYRIGVNVSKKHVTKPSVHKKIDRWSQTQKTCPTSSQFVKLCTSRGVYDFSRLKCEFNIQTGGKN